MSGGWAGSNRRSELPADWNQIREVVLTECGRRCEWRYPNGGRCRARATQVDHVVAGNNHSRKNLRGLCAFHHGIKSSREGNDAQKPKTAQQTFRHPGMLR